MSRQAGCGPPKNDSTLSRAMSAKSGTPLVRRHQALVADRAQQRHRQRARPDAGLDDPGAREDVGHVHDLAGVLGIDHRRAARHRQHVVGEQRAAARGRSTPPVVVTTVPSGLPDQRVVGDRALVGVELLAGDQGDRVHPALGVGELDPVAHGERAAAVGGAGGAGRSDTVGESRRGRRRQAGRPLAHVGGGEDPVDLAAGLDHEVLAGREAARSPRPGPRRPGPPRRPGRGSRRRARSLTGTHGRRSLGGRQDGAPR